MAAPTITPFIRSFSISFAPSAEADVAGYLIHAVPALAEYGYDAQTQTFTPNEAPLSAAGPGNLINKGPESSFLYTLPKEWPGGWWAVRYCAYDTFGIDELNYSQCYLVNVEELFSLWYLDATSPVFFKNAPDAATDGSHTAVTITGRKFSGTTTIEIGWLTLTATGDSEILALGAGHITYVPPADAGKSSYTVNLYAGPDGGDPIDTQTLPVVFRGATGAAGLTVVLSNEAHTLPCSPEGVPTTYDGSGTDIYVYENDTALSYADSGLPGTFQVTAVGVGITAGEITAGAGGKATVAPHTDMSANPARVAYAIDICTLDGKTLTVLKNQSLTKAVAGESTVVADLTNDTHVLPVDSSGTVTSFFGAVTTFTLYVGSQDVTSAWTLTVTYSLGLTAHAVTDNGRMQQVDGLTADSGYIKFRATRTGYSPVEALFTVTKASAGSDGKSYRLISSSSVIAKATDGTYMPAILTFSGQLVAGNSTPSAYAGKLAVHGTTNGTTYTSLYTSGSNEASYTLTTATLSSSLKALLVRLYPANTTDFANAAFLDEETLPVVKDGATGTPGKTYSLIITNGVRGFSWNLSGASPTPAPSAFGCTLTESGVQVTPETYYWSTGANGLISGSGTGSTFTPTVASTYDATKGDNYVKLAVTYAGQTFETSVPIVCTKAAADGTKSITISAYRWTNVVISQAPNQQFTYIWATGAPTEYPELWTAAAGSAPGTTTGYTLYKLDLVITDVATATQTTTLNWSSATLNTVGYRKDGTIGPQGAGARIAYGVAASSTTFTPDSTVTTAGAATFPGTGVNFGVSGITWQATPGTYAVNQALFQTDGVYDPVTGNTVWQTPYLCNLKVGSLSAISANLGSVSVGTDGAVYSTGKTYESTAPGFFLGYHGSAYKLDIGDTTKNLRWDGSNLTVTGDIITTSNIQTNAVTVPKFGKCNPATPYTANIELTLSQPGSILIIATIKFNVVNNQFFLKRSINGTTTYLISGDFYSSPPGTATVQYLDESLAAGTYTYTIHDALLNAVNATNATITALGAMR